MPVGPLKPGFEQARPRDQGQAQVAIGAAPGRAGAAAAPPPGRPPFRQRLNQAGSGRAATTACTLSGRSTAAVSALRPQGIADHHRWPLNHLIEECTHLQGKAVVHRSRRLGGLAKTQQIQAVDPPALISRARRAVAPVAAGGAEAMQEQQGRARFRAADPQWRGQPLHCQVLWTHSAVWMATKAAL